MKVGKDATMARSKQAARSNGTTKVAAATTLGAVGLGLSLAGGASASTLPAADISQSDNNLHRLALNDEEMADVSLATFHLFDRELGGTGGLQQVAWGCRCGGCRGCRGCGWRGCRCGGCGGCGGCCARWGRCRWC
jgi:hypothetical protein